MKCWIWLAILTSSGLLAQNDLQANVNLQFRFTNPGARAQAMGGAFVGLADDTTAMFANPAGLAQLNSSSLVLEGNQVSEDNPIPFYGGRIQQTGLQDFSFDLEERDFPNDTIGVPFLGYVNGKSRIKWGVFYAELANMERQFNTLGVGVPSYPPGRDVVDNTIEIFLPSQNSLDLSLRSIGVSVGGKLGERFWWGGTALYYDFSYTANSTLFFPDLEALFPDETFPPGQLEALRPLIGQTLTTVDVRGDDQRVGFFTGVMYAPNERFSLGLAYKQQPKFDYDHTSATRDAAFELAPFDSGTARFNVPDSYGMGISFRPSDVLVLAVDVNRVVYSDLADDYHAFFVNSDDSTGGGQTIGDATEYHIGVEYFITATKYPLALRAGYWLDPYHALVNINSDTQLLFRYSDDAGDLVQDIRPTAFLQRFEEDENHLTAGFGLSLGRHFILDFSADIAKYSQNLSLSGIYRF